jgi:hypothetical protein
MTTGNHGNLTLPDEAREVSGLPQWCPSGQFDDALFPLNQVRLKNEHNVLAIH